MKVKKKLPLVTISIPTRNSALFLPKCLQAIRDQTYINIEINIVDADSSDETVEIAKKSNVKNVINYTKALLGARFEGVRCATGEYTLFLDSDQILKRDAVAKAVEKMNEGYDMLILEEGVYRSQTWIEKLFAADRKLIESVKDYSPYTGVLLPRFYKTSVLTKAFSKIPKSIIEKVGGQDHAIIYFEAWKVSQKVGYVEKAVVHIEPDSLMKIWKKFYRWGYTSINAHFGKYDELFAKKERFRTGLFKKGLILESIGSIVLLILKGIPYKLGYYSAKFKL